MRVKNRPLDLLIRQEMLTFLNLISLELEDYEAD